MNVDEKLSYSTDNMVWLVGWFGFNSTFTQKRRYCTIKETTSQLLKRTQKGNIN